MSGSDDLAPVLKKLRLSGVLQTLELRARQATEDGLPYGEFLYLLLHDEVERREAKQLELRLRRASFDEQKTLHDFDFGFNVKIPKARIIELATCGFVVRRENVLLMGPAGTGKSHIGQALGHRACEAGHSVLYVSAPEMLRDLRAARADQSHERRLLRYTNPDLLVVDDLGLRPLRQDEPLDLSEVIRRRYRRGSMVVTSNRAVEEWYPLFGDDLLASAAMDRLLHDAHVVEMEGHSYRNPPPGIGKNRTTSNAGKTPTRKGKRAAE
jgi:DNA replication protein DnaC